MRWTEVQRFTREEFASQKNSGQIRIRDYRRLQTRVRMKAYQADVPLFSRNNIIEAFVNGVWRHDQVCSYVLQNGEAPRESTLLGRYFCRAAVGVRCTPRTSSILRDRRHRVS